MLETIQQSKSTVPVQGFGPQILDGSAILLVSDADIFREVFLNVTLFPKPRTFIKLSKFILGENIITSEGERWKKDRRLLTPLFHFGALKHYASHFDEIGKDITRFLITDNQTGKLVKSTFFREYTMKGIIQSAFGNEINHSIVYQAEESISTALRNYFICSVLFGSLANYLPLPAFRKIKAANKIIQDEVNRLILLRKKQIESNSEPKDLISVMLNAKEPIPENFITDEGILFLFAGADTTSSLLQWWAYFMCEYADVQNKMRLEVDQVREENPGVEIKDLLNKFVYSKQVLNECLRMRPPVPVVNRETMEDCELGGYKIPKGCELQLFLHQVHMDPKYWHKPTEFIPERFGENSVYRHPFAFVPFVGGERNCLGQKFALEEALIFSVHLISNFCMESSNLHNVGCVITATMAPSNFFIKFVPRKKNI